MNILLVSECEKKALNNTRRILDQFAERLGERTWATPITEAGLLALRKLLRQTARKNTAVACHWIKPSGPELLFIVGNAKKFNERGVVPTNHSELNILREEAEQTWPTRTLLKAVSSLAGLLHDLGKASIWFQDKLRAKALGEAAADPYRHEWVSLRIFLALIHGATDNDEAWLKRLIAINPEQLDLRHIAMESGFGSDTARDYPFKALPPLAKLVSWLILTHHRLPNWKKDSPPVQLGRTDLDPLGYVRHDAGYANEEDDRKEGVRAKKLPSNSRDLNSSFNRHAFHSEPWRKAVQDVCKSLLGIQGLRPAESQSSNQREQNLDPFVAAIGRLALNLADHHVSQAKPGSNQHAMLPVGASDFDLYANTWSRESGVRERNQKLDVHLLAVGHEAGQIARALPALRSRLSKVQNKRFWKRATGAFAWQDQAADLAVRVSERSKLLGFFGVNLASTGCGKTVANARIIHSLHPRSQGSRFTIALGLRTLTLQTGAALADRLGLGSDELAVLVGGHDTKQLFAALKANADGAESRAPLLEPEFSVVYEGSSDCEALNDYLAGKSSNEQKLLAAPVLVCTIDHLMQASEGKRGGRQILPLLRLLSSDIVLDEPDEFSVDDLPALGRFVYTVGLMGGRLLLSSATITPSIAQGLFIAYAAGRDAYCRNTQVESSRSQIQCAWFDEFGVRETVVSSESVFRSNHDLFVTERSKHLIAQPARRIGALWQVGDLKGTGDQLYSQLMETLRRACMQLHDQFAQCDTETGKMVSIGLVRIAHVKDLIELARCWVTQDALDDTCFHLTIYHSRLTLPQRALVETGLDQTLSRHLVDGLDPLLSKPLIRSALVSNKARHHVFVVLASPVAEVGRDHCYDWAVVEPSSMRSIIQLAGRVRRHRPGAVDQTNVLVLSTNIRALDTNQECVFTNPGFEKQGTDSLKLRTHDLNSILPLSLLRPINALARIAEPADLRPSEFLNDLEHSHLRQLLVDRDAADIPNIQWFWVQGWWQTGFFQTKTRFRRSDGKPEEFKLQVDPDTLAMSYCQWRDDMWRPANERFEVQVAPKLAHGIHLFLSTTPAEAVCALAAQLNLDIDEVCGRFGRLNLSHRSPSNRPSDKSQVKWIEDSFLGYWVRY